MSRRLLSRASVVFGVRILIGAIVVLACNASAQLLLVVSDGADVYRDVAGDVARRVRMSEPTAHIDTLGVRDAQTIGSERLAHYALVVTVGVDAARAVTSPSPAGAAAHPPVLALLVPRERFGDIEKTAAGGRVSAIFIEQPLARQLDLVAVALPRKARVGVLLGPTSAALAQELEDAARAAGVELNRAQANDAAAVYPALQHALQQSDILLAIPDAVAVNAATIRSVLVASHQAKVPVVGFSQALVDAGALLAVYSTPRQYARQAAEIVLDVLTRNAALPAPQYPRYFTVGVNFLAAQSIGLALDDESTLAAALAVRAREREKDRARSQSGSMAHAAAGTSR